MAHRRRETSAPPLHIGACAPNGSRSTRPRTLGNKLLRAGKSLRSRLCHRSAAQIRRALGWLRALLLTPNTCLGKLAVSRPKCCGNFVPESGKGVGWRAVEVVERSSAGHDPRCGKLRSRRGCKDASHGITWQRVKWVEDAVYLVPVAGYSVLTIPSLLPTQLAG